MRQKLFTQPKYSLTIFAIILAIVPFMLGLNNYYVYLAANVLLIAIMVSSWNIIGGMAGQLDLGASAYLGLGGAISGLLLATHNITPWIGMPMGALVSIGVAILIGYPTFRFGVKEVWYALLTAALVYIFQRIFWLIYGTTEIYMPAYKSSWYYLRFDRYEPFYYILMIILILTIIVNLKVKRSKIGYYFEAIREDEMAAEALGIDTRKYKLYALIIYAGILGFTGGIYVNMTSIVSYRMFDPWLGIVIAVMGLIGGLGSLAGGITAAIILRTIEEYLRGAIGAIIPGAHLLIYGILIIVVAVLRPEGIGGIIESLVKKGGKK